MLRHAHIVPHARVSPSVPPHRADIEGMSVKELKQFLASKGVSVKGLYEKHELLEAALDASGEPKL